jgi:peptidoglycan/xylan/chitin deacetylase (PgdA/CDA1 family)
MTGLSATLRSVLFHRVSDSGSAFTDGLGVTRTEADFRDQVDFLRRRYQPVDLAAVAAAAGDGEPLPPRALLVTIDDAYSSVADVMAGVLDDARIPSVFFVNGSFVDHQALGTDNLVTYTANTIGGGVLQSATREIRRSARVTSIDEALGELVPTLDQATLRRFREALLEAHDHDPLERARSERLYIDSAALAGLPESMAIGSHTSSHVRCRSLREADFGPELDDNRARLESLTSRPVTAFSVPYGSRADLTRRVAAAVAAAGHDQVFLVEGQLNHGQLCTDRIYRVSLSHGSSLGTLLELEVLPRVRYLRDLVLRR